MEPPGAAGNAGSHTVALAKDKAKLAVAAVKGEDTQDLYVAVTKATLPDEVVPKEKHVRTLRIACSAHSSRNTVEYIIYKLGKRLSNPSWVVVLKSLMTFHRLLRECDSSFQDQLLRFSDRTGRHHMLSLERFADHSSREAWDYSAWVRVYSAYLAERLEVYRNMRFDPEGNVSTAHPQQHAGGSYENGAGAAAPAAMGGAYGGPTGGAYGSAGGAYGGPTGGYGGPPAGPYGGPTGGVYGGPTGGYGGQPGGPYGGGPAAGAGGVGPFGGATGAYGAAPGQYGAPGGAYAGPTGTNGYGGGGAAAAGGGGAPPASGIKLKDCAAAELLTYLPKMQHLMGRLLVCVPEGASASHPVILTSCSWVLKESRAVYKAASEGVMNLADKFFEMERAQAVQGIELYKENLGLTERLNAYYAAMQNLPALRNIIQYPHLAPLPADFLTAMEEYVRDAPKEVDPAAAARRAGSGPLAANRVSSLAAHGGTTSSAFAGGSVSLSPPPGELRTPRSPMQEQEEAAAAREAAETAAAAAAAAAAAPKMPEIDLLSFDDSEPAPVAAAAAAPAPSARGELDFLVDGMTQQQQQQPAAAAADGFGEPAAFGPDGSVGGAAPGPNPYGYSPYGAPNPYGPPNPYAGPTGGYGMPADPYGNPFMGPYAGPTGAMGPQSMAIVPVGPMGGMGAIVPYGMGPFAGPTGMLGSSGGGAGNPFNPFLATAPPAAPVEAGPLRMANDPLNELTEELLKPKDKSKAPEGPLPTLNEIKQQRMTQQPGQQ